MPIYRSASQLNYVKCGKRFELERLKKVPQRQAAWTFHGTTVHAVLLKDDDGHGWESSGRKMTLRQRQAKFDHVWNTELAQAKEKEPDLNKWFRGGRTKTEKDLENRYALGLKQVEQYIEYASTENFKPISINGELALETKFEWNIGPNPYMMDACDGDEDVIIVGYIDLVGQDSNGTGKVRDIKTGNEPFWSLQLPTYGYALEEVFGLLIDWGDYFLCKQERPSSSKDLTSTSKDEVLEYYFRMDEAVRRGIFLVNASADNCRFCSVQDHCPIFF